jgi:predicted GNAT superfamily acetyltransferase
MLGDIEIQLVTSPAQAAEASALFDNVWDATSMVSPELIVAALHSGGYCALARRGREVVGASFALATNIGILHSHVTGVAQDHAGEGIGAQLKRHQWYWAQAHDYRAITWTFDPLVRRNAWFNLVKLGANVISYHEDFYGELTDAINAGDHSDRLLVRWLVLGTDDPQTGTFVEADTGDVVVPTPPDIETLRRTDRSAAVQWRSRQRQLLALLSQPGASIRGLNDEYAYVITFSRDKIA